MRNLFRQWFFKLMYLRRPPWDTGVSPPELMQFIESHPPGRALDLGCGTGTNVLALTRHGWEVTGVDFVSRAIQQARQKSQALGLSPRFICGDVTRLENVNPPFDLILDIGCFHSIPPDRHIAYRQNINRLLVPGGTFLLYVFFRRAGERGPGVDEAILGVFSPPLKLVRREEGLNRGVRPSAWLTYQKT